MPLHIDIRINDRLLRQVHIGRISGGAHPDSVNSYRTVITAPGVEPDYFAADSVAFTHRYGDGAVACAQAALTALTPLVGIADAPTTDHAPQPPERHRP
jgi:hypothetical protein